MTFDNILFQKKSTKIKYLIHDEKLLTIIKCFKQWKHYLKNCQFIVTIMFDHNNLKYFMFTIILNKKQIRWTFFFEKIWFRNQIQIKQFQFCEWFFKKSNYENESLDDICLFILQNKFQNIFVSKIEFLNNDSKKENFNSKFENDNDFKKNSNFEKMKIIKQTTRKMNAKKTCAKKFIYENSFELFLNKIKKIQFRNKYCRAIWFKLNHIEIQIKKT